MAEVKFENNEPYVELYPKKKSLAEKIKEKTKSGIKGIGSAVASKIDNKINTMIEERRIYEQEYQKAKKQAKINYIKKKAIMDARRSVFSAFDVPMVSSLDRNMNSFFGRQSRRILKSRKKKKRPKHRVYKSNSLWW